MTPSTPEILARLVAEPTVSRTSNLALLDYVESLLRPVGARIERFAHADGSRANLFATVGPDGPGGVVLSGHTDVVPVEGQAWSRDPFTLAERDGRFYGRGTADMKGFVAASLRAAFLAADRPLKRPLHLAFSYDEEIGCIGVRGMIEALGLKVDYVAARNADTLAPLKEGPEAGREPIRLLAAAWLGETRLIDNIPV